MICRVSFPEGYSVILDSTASEDPVKKVLLENLNQRQELAEGDHDITPYDWNNRLMDTFVHVNPDGTGSCLQVPRRDLPDSDTIGTLEIVDGKVVSERRGVRVHLLNGREKDMPAIARPTGRPKTIELREIVFFLPGITPVRRA